MLAGGVQDLRTVCTGVSDVLFFCLRVLCSSLGCFIEAGGVEMLGVAVFWCWTSP